MLTVPQRAPAQTPESTPEPLPETLAAPLPDINTLMRQVEANQRKSEALERDYIYHVYSQTDTTDSDGKLKKSESRDAEIFWVNGTRIGRHLRTDGKDLSPDEQKKESDRIDKRIADARARRDKALAAGKDPNPHASDELSFARILELGAFSNERRGEYAGRPAILIDYTGDPHVKTHNPLEGAFKELGGTVWIDAADRVLVHIEARFLNDFKLGAGLLVDVHKETSFESSWTKINNEVWLPAGFSGHGSARAMLFFSVHGASLARFTGYRKFKATATLSPDFTKVDDPTPTPDATTPPPSPK